MIDALVSGRLVFKPQQRTGASGKTFVTCRIRAADGSGEGTFISAICFEPDVCRALLALDAGDSVALSGSLTPKVYVPAQGEPRPALDLVVHACLTAYHISRRRKAQARPPDPWGGDDLELDDEAPF